jgi:hypothetical protein
MRRYTHSQNIIPSSVATRSYIATLPVSLAPAYATTFNSCQGLTLEIVEVDLTRPVFSHGQLYTAPSRIRHHNDAKAHLCPGETTTTNVTYQEILI